jgi:hypothetical protein
MPVDSSPAIPFGRRHGTVNYRTCGRATGQLFGYASGVMDTEIAGKGLLKTATHAASIRRIRGINLIIIGTGGIIIFNYA